MIDKMTEECGHEVLRLPLFPLPVFTIVGCQLKWCENVYNESLVNVIGHIRGTFNSVTPENWANSYYSYYIHHDGQGGRWERDKIIDKEIDPVIIALDDETGDELFDDGCSNLLTF